MNDERGVASLVAIMILLMLAYMIRGTSFTAGIYAETIRNFQVENELQHDAESKLAETIAYYTSKEFTDAEIGNATVENGVQLKVSELAVDGTTRHVLLILAVAKKADHFDSGINAYRSAAAFLTGTEIESGVYRYEFKGFLARKI